MVKPDPPPQTLAEVARAQQRARDAAWEAAQRGEGDPELFPMDAGEQAALMDALRPSLPRARPRAWRAAAVVVLAAAAVVLLWAVGVPETTLPRYTLSVPSGDQALRSPGESSRYSRGSRVEFVLQPASPVTEPVTVTVWAERPTGERVELPWPVERGREGALRVRAVLGDELSPGAWVLVVSLASGRQTHRHPISVEDSP